MEVDSKEVMLIIKCLQPGNPNSNTKDGYGSMMEVGYVAHYVSY